MKKRYILLIHALVGDEERIMECGAHRSWNKAINVLMGMEAREGMYGVFIMYDAQIYQITGE